MRLFMVTAWPLALWLSVGAAGPVHGFSPSGEEPPGLSDPMPEAAGRCGGLLAPVPGHPSACVNSLRGLGAIPRPRRHAGRDVGFSALLGGRSAWIFGDTFLPRRAADGLQWRSSSWSCTSDRDGADGIGAFRHALDPDGLALQLLPHTPAEADFNRLHEGHEDCMAGMDCGARRTPWPGAIVASEAGESAVIFYLNMETGADGEWDFRSVSGSVALWRDPSSPAERIEPPLFGAEEPDWGSAAVLDGAYVYVYACEFDGSGKPCLVARAPLAKVTKRDRYEFWGRNGKWSAEWRDAVPAFSGGSLFSVHYNAYLGRFLAFYTAGLGGGFHLRTAPRPEGPWSEAVVFGRGEPAVENWNYALIAHPEFSRESGRVEILSYTRPSGFLEQETRLVEVRFD